jgi:hypothetical protein
MFATRARRRLVLLAVLVGAGAAIGWYRRRALDRNAQDFHARYG